MTKASRAKKLKYQEENLETSDNQIDNRETCQSTGRIRTIPDASLSEPDTESMGAARNMDTSQRGCTVRCNRGQLSFSPNEYDSEECKNVQSRRENNN